MTLSAALQRRYRLAYFTAALGLLLYAVRSVVQLLSLRSELQTSDFPRFYTAARQLAAGQDPYAGFLSSCPGFHWCLGGYIYPPLLAAVMRPLTALSMVQADAVWIVLSQLMLLATVAIVYATIGRWLSRAALGLLLAASALFLPVYQNLYSGQVGALLLLVLAGAAWGFVSSGGRSIATGTLLASGALLRITPAAMAPMLVRGRRDLAQPLGVLAFLVTSIGGLLLLQVLTPPTGEYLTQVLPRITVGTGFISNVSPTGALIRLQVALLGPPLPGFAVLTSALGVAALAVTWWCSRNASEPRARAAVFAAFLAVTPVASGITWNYHLVNELLVLALLAPSLTAASRAWWLAVASYPLLWVYSDGVIAAGGPGLGVPLILLLSSLNAIGAIVLWLACLQVIVRQPRGVGE